MLTAEEEIERFIKTYVDRLYFGFSPRPDQPDRFDEQTSFIKSKHPGITLLLGGNGAGTTTCALMKAIRFMIAEQPAPRLAEPCPQEAWHPSRMIRTAPVLNCADSPALRCLCLCDPDVVLGRRGSGLR